MDISLGLVIALVLVLFPGLIIRRLYYYGEFSKQFSSGHSITRTLAISTIPGLINLVCIFLFYNSFISKIDIEGLINTFKDLNNPEQHINLSDSPEPIKDVVNTRVIPFLSFLYTSSFIIGSMSGRFVRITRLDTKFKLLRFKNYWFYVFSGELTRFKKMKHLKENNKKHLFTRADILIDSNTKTHLYSGVVIDYELSESNCQILNKVMLQNAERYKLVDGKRIRVKIPGNLLVVDCTKMRNINLTYVFEKADKFLESKYPIIIDNVFSFIIVLIIPFFIFKTEFISWQFYIDYFSLTWYEKILYYLAFSQGISIANPFIKNKKTNEYEFIGYKRALFKFIAFLIYLGIIYLL